MRRAESIVNQMLEAVAVPMPHGSVLAVKNDEPKVFRGLNDFYAWVGDGHVDKFLAGGGAYFVRDASGKVRLYSQQIPLRMRPETTDFVLQTFGLSPNEGSNIAYSPGPRLPVSSKPLAHVLPRPQWEPAKVKKQKPVKEPDTEPPMSNGVPVKQRTTESVASQYTLGFSCAKGTQGGLLVRVVERGTAAAKAGLLPNDVVLGVGEYTNTAGAASPSVRIRNAAQLRHVLGLHQPQSVLPLLVRRGSGIVELPIVPELAAKEPPQAQPPQAQPPQAQKPQEPPTRPNEPETAATTGSSPTPSAMRNYY